MFIILVYDLQEGRTQKMHNKCNKFLTWKQNSVFEGELTESQLKKLRNWIQSYVYEEETVLIYEFRSENAFTKHVYGTETVQDTFI